jgi:hypothetical protein
MDEWYSYFYEIEKRMLKERSDSAYLDLILYSDLLKKEL